MEIAEIDLTTAAPNDTAGRAIIQVGKSSHRLAVSTAKFNFLILFLLLDGFKKKMRINRFSEFSLIFYGD